MDTFDLTSLLTSLQIQSAISNQLSEPHNPDFSTFHPYPILPTELRLKILTYALPIHTIIPLKAHVLLSDPSFGLYLTFSVVPTKNPQSGARNSIFPPQKTDLSSAEIKKSRALGLLQVNHESRDFYMEQFPLTLPSGDGTTLSTIRFSPHETVHLKNFDKLLGQPAFIRAINDNYRLQTFWCKVERLAIPVVPLVYRAMPSVALEKVARRFEGLRVLEMRMWDLFEEREGEGRKSIRRSMDIHLRQLEQRLRRIVEEEGEEEKGGYVVPELVVV